MCVTNWNPAWIISIVWPDWGAVNGSAAESGNIEQADKSKDNVSVDVSKVFVHFIDFSESKTPAKKRKNDAKILQNNQLSYTLALWKEFWWNVIFFLLAFFAFIASNNNRSTEQLSGYQHAYLWGCYQKQRSKPDVFLSCYGVVWRGLISAWKTERRTRPERNGFTRAAARGSLDNWGYC